MQTIGSSSMLRMTGWGFAAFGILLAAGGLWLTLLGGSWFYLSLGAALIATAALLLQGRMVALWIYSLIVVITLGWAIWEAGLDWWPLAARGDLVFLFGIFLLMPWVTSPLAARSGTRAFGSRGGGTALSAALCLALVAAAVSWFTDPHRINGSLAGAPPSPTASASSEVPPGEWPAYGRTQFGQRYSPLHQITLANVEQLQVAWHYHTGDMRGRPGDPVETTFEVTPLKVANRLFLCTPHQDVVALDATTGTELWRHDTHLLDELALQHLTCRGLAYAADLPPGTAPAPNPARLRAARATVPNLPVAAKAASTTDCTARLFLPIADGRLVALDPESGAVCRNFGGGAGQVNLWANMPNVRPGAYYSTSPPVVAGGLVVVGGTVLDNVSTTEQSGVIRAYDVRSGAFM